MSQQYRLTPSAKNDVDLITAFIAEESVEAALRVFDALEDAFELLAHHPEMGHLCEV